MVHHRRARQHRSERGEGQGANLDRARAWEELSGDQAGEHHHDESRHGVEDLDAAMRVDQRSNREEERRRVPNVCLGRRGKTVVIAEDVGVE